MALELARTLHQRAGARSQAALRVRRRECGDQHDRRARPARRSAKSPVRRFVSRGNVRDYVEHAPHRRRVHRAGDARAGRSRAARRFRDTTSSVYLIPDVSLYDLIQARVGDVDGIPVIALCESPLQGRPRRDEARHRHRVRGAVARRRGAGDGAHRLAIKLDSPGRVFFKQDRYGLDGERIVVYKFRTMTVCENGDRHRAGEARRRARDARRPVPCGARRSTSCRSSSTCCKGA